MSRTDADVAAGLRDAVLEAYAFDLADGSSADQHAQLCAVQLIASAELMDVCMRVNAVFDGCDMSAGDSDGKPRAVSPIMLAVADATAG